MTQGSADLVGATICSRDSRSYRIDVTMTRNFSSYGSEFYITRNPLVTVPGAENKSCAKWLQRPNQ